MKSTVALTLLATIALHQVAYAQNDAPAMPTLPTPVTDIYWWKTLLTGDEINNYLTGPATEAATSTQQDATTTQANKPTPTINDNLSAAATPTDNANSSVDNKASDAASSALDNVSTSSGMVAASSGALSPSAIAWTSSSANVPVAVAPTVKSSSAMSPKPSGSIIPASSTSNPARPSSEGSAVLVTKVLFSVTLAAVLRNLL